MVEEADAGKAHDHVVRVTGSDDVVVADGAAGLCHILHAAAISSLDIVAEGEECIGTECYIGVARQPFLLLFRSENSGLLGSTSMYSSPM